MVGECQIGSETGVGGFDVFCLFLRNQISDIWEKWGLTYGKKGRRIIGCILDDE
jgi:hypothetical protein